MKLILLTTIALTLSSCGAFQRFTTNLTGGLTYKCSKHGTEYVQSDSGLAVSRKNGEDVICR